MGSNLSTPSIDGRFRNDQDEDGLTNIQEFALFTNPLLWDSDEDGLSDWDEVNTHQSNPLRE